MIYVESTDEKDVCLMTGNFAALGCDMELMAEALKKEELKDVAKPLLFILLNKFEFSSEDFREYQKTLAEYDEWKEGKPMSEVIEKLKPKGDE